jgi:hypothetical protein
MPSELERMSERWRQLIEEASNPLEKLIERSNATSYLLSMNKSLLDAVPRALHQIDALPTMTDALKYVEQLRPDFSYVNDLAASLGKIPLYTSEELGKALETYSREPLVEAVEAVARAYSYQIVSGHSKPATNGRN